MWIGVLGAAGYVTPYAYATLQQSAGLPTAATAASAFTGLSPYTAAAQATLQEARLQWCSLYPSPTVFLPSSILKTGLVCARKWEIKGSVEFISLEKTFIKLTFVCIYEDRKLVKSDWKIFSNVVS